MWDFIFILIKNYSFEKFIIITEKEISEFMKKSKGKRIAGLSFVKKCKNLD